MKLCGTFCLEVGVGAVAKVTKKAKKGTQRKPPRGGVKLKVGDTECPLQVCQLSRSSESTHFRSFVEM